jgi:hypothetical protein
MGSSNHHLHITFFKTPTQATQGAPFCPSKIPLDSDDDPNLQWWNEVSGAVVYAAFLGRIIPLLRAASCTNGAHLWSGQSVPTSE